MAIRIYFSLFNANQLFSPIVGEYKYTLNRLKFLSSIISAQLTRTPRVNSKTLPTPIKITFIINKINYEPTCFLILTHKLLNILKQTTILQDTNESCVKSITIAHKTTNNPKNEGCIIEFTE